MMPIGPLMIEHRLIEKIIPLLKNEITTINKKNKANPVFIENTVDFFRMYADRCHHGKEEEILFRDLEKKQLSPEHKKIMDELLEEHKLARKTVGNLVEAKNLCVKGKTEAMKEIINNLSLLSEFYPKHIEKEDKRFFIPIMKYFSKQEQDDMLQEFWDFDKTLIHEKYKRVLEDLKSKSEP